MLLQKLGTTIDPNVVKYVAEIYLADREPQLSTALSSITFKGSTKDEPGHHCYSELERFLSENGYTNVGGLLNYVIRYMLDKGTRDVYIDYCRIPRMTSILKKTLIEKLKIKGNYNFDMNPIINKFGEFFINNCMNGEGVTINAGYIVNAFSEFFLKTHSKYIYDYINEKGTVVKSGSENLSLSKLSVLDISKSSGTTFEFQRDIERIYKASKLLYPVTKKGNADLYTNLVTEYSRYVVRDYLESSKFMVILANIYFRGGKISNYMKKIQEGVFFPKIYVSKPVWLQGLSYRINTYKLRTEVTDFLFKYLNKNISCDDLQVMYKYCKGVESNYVGDHNVSLIFRFGDTEESITDDKEDFMTLLEGLKSLSNLIQYCNSNSIDIQTIPLEIFQSDKYFIRFKSLEDCMLCYTHTSKLIDNDSSIINHSLMSNDDLYNWIKSNKNLNFLNLTDMIEEKMDKRKRTEQEYDTFVTSNCKSIFNKLLKNTIEFNNYAKVRFGGLEQADEKKMDNLMDSDLEELFRACDLNNNMKEIESNFSFLSINEGASTILVPLDSYSGMDRFCQIKLFVLSHIFYMLEKIPKLNRYDLIIEIGDGRISPLPNSIDSLQDLASIKNYYLTAGGKPMSLDLNYGDYDMNVLREINSYYEIVCKELKIYVEYFNNRVNKIVSSSYTDGIETSYVFSINQALVDASDYIYESSPMINIPSFNNLCRVCQKPNGYLYMDSRPYIYKNCFVHEYGYLVTEQGIVLRAVTEDDRL